jgi:hypothetical protein
MPASGFTPTKCGSDEPKHRKDHGRDPQQVSRETRSEQQQHHEKYE